GLAAGTLDVAAKGKVKWIVHVPGLAKASTGSVALTDDGQVPLYVESGTPRLEGWLALGEQIAGELTHDLDRPTAVVGGRYSRPPAGERLLGATAENPALRVTLHSTEINGGTPLVL